MVALARAKDGRWFARKAIPEDVCEKYAELYGSRREAHFKIAGDTPHSAAKAQKNEWEAEVEPHSGPRPHPERASVVRPQLAPSSFAERRLLGPKRTAVYRFRVHTGCIRSLIDSGFRPNSNRSGQISSPPWPDLLHRDH
jgi:hypothetical protein